MTFFRPSPSNDLGRHRSLFSLETLVLTASFGAAAAHGDYLGPPDGALALLALADGALYRAKRAGRDRVEAA